MFQMENTIATFLKYWSFSSKAMHKYSYTVEIFKVPNSGCQLAVLEGNATISAKTVFHKIGKCEITYSDSII